MNSCHGFGRTKKSFSLSYSLSNPKVAIKTGVDILGTQYLDTTPLCTGVWAVCVNIGSLVQSTPAIANTLGTLSLCPYLRESVIARCGKNTPTLLLKHPLLSTATLLYSCFNLTFYNFLSLLALIIIYENTTLVSDYMLNVKQVV